MIKQHIVTSCDAEGCTARYVEDIDLHRYSHLSTYPPDLPFGWRWYESRLEGSKTEGDGVFHYCPGHKVTTKVTVEDEAS